ncbi:MAG TPA: c-type cytochrome, partial [Gemmatimonadetes bacterium]|nr:c-type cytochrome [Gemmatimonadota bacterium]
KPVVSYLFDKRPVVVSRAIEALAKEENVDALRAAKATLPATWALHRIPGAAARKAIRERIITGTSDVRAAAIHSVGLWHDAGAVTQLSDTLIADDAQLRRLAAMALGRIGDKTAVKALTEAGAKELDPFLKHAITYALFEIGDNGSIPEGHPLGKQLRRMEELAQRDPAPHSRPEIQWTEVVNPDPKTMASQQARLKELIQYLPRGNPKRGKVLFSDVTKSLCILCHVKGEQGAHFGPDLTKIGAIRTRRDLLEAIVYPSASIARYYEWVKVRTKEGETSGLLLKDGVDNLILTPGPGVELPVPLEEIKEAKYSNISLMPQVFDGLLKPEELADLIAYLSQAK